MSDNVPVPTVELLIKELKDVVDDWKVFGVSLGVPVRKLNAIELADPRGGVENWKLKMFQFWLQYKPDDPSWKDVVRALEENNYIHLATTLSRKYLLPADSNEDEDKSINEDEIKAEIRATAAVVEKLRDLESSFTDMLTDLLDLFTECKCDLSRARFFLDDRLDTEKFSQCTSFDSLLRQLRKGHIDAFNTYYLKRLVTRFKKDELTERIKEYEAEKEIFLKDTTVLEFQRAVVSKVEPLPSGQMIKLTIKISKRLADKRSLKDMEELALRSFGECQDFICIHAEPGSVIISWFFPEALSDKLEHLARKNAAVFKDAGVEEVTVGGRVVFPCTLEEDIPAASLKEIYTDSYHRLVEAVSDERTCQSLLTQLSSPALISKEKIAQLTSSKVTGSSFLKTLGLEEEPHLLVPLVSAMSGVEQLQTLAENMSTVLRSKQDLVDEGATKEAIKEEVEVSISKLVVSGSPGSGKTCVVTLSVGEPAPDVRNSTGCVETPVRAIAQSTICINGTKFQKLETEQMLYKVCQAMRHRVDEIKSEEFVKEKRRHKVPSVSTTTPPPSTDSSPSMSDDIPMSTEASSSASAEDKDETNLQVFAKLLAKISSAEASTDFLTAHLVLTIDSGGQPHFMDVAPLFLRNNSLFLLTLKLNEPLDSKPKFDYFINGQPIEMKNKELQPTNLQLIELLAKSISSLQLTTSTTPSSDGSESRHAKFMIVGTFADKAEDCSVADKNSILRDRLKDYEAERIDAGDDVIFAVNAITTDPDERQEVALRLQDKITNTPGTTIKKKIRLRWFGLLLYLFDEAEKTKMPIIPLEDVLAAGICLQMPKKETLQAMTFFHELNLLMHFSGTDKLHEIVFINAKLILSKLSNLIGISFIDKGNLDKIFTPNLSADDLSSLRKYGRFSREILDLSFHFSAPLTTDVFLDLLEHLCVIARIEKYGQTSFFLPCALPHAPENILQEMEQISSSWIVTLQTRRKGLLRNVPIPKSYLPTLAVHLLNLPEFETPTDCGTRQYRNLMCIHYVDGGHIYLIERNLQLEICYSCAGSGKISQDCFFIRFTIKKALTKVEKSLNFVPGILIKNDAFLCSCPPHHIREYKETRNETQCKICKNFEQLSQQQQCWLQDLRTTSNPDGHVINQSSSAAVTSKPTMNDLINIKKQDCSDLEIIRWITSHESHQCLDFAHKLLRDRLTVRELCKKHKDDDNAFVRAVMEKWLSGDDARKKGSLPCTWEALIQCVEEAGLEGELVIALRDNFPKELISS